MLPILLAAAQVFTLEGRLMPKAKAAVTVHAASSPYTVSTPAHVDGKFTFKTLEPGIYTVIVFVSGRGEIRNSVSVEPSSADKKGRVRITIDTESGALSRDRAHLVGARELAVPESARREYASAMKRLSARDPAGAIRHWSVPSRSRRGLQPHGITSAPSRIKPGGPEMPRSTSGVS